MLSCAPMRSSHELEVGKRVGGVTACELRTAFQCSLRNCALCSTLLLQVRFLACAQTLLACHADAAITGCVFRLAREAFCLGCSGCLALPHSFTCPRLQGLRSVSPQPSILKRCPMRLPASCKRCHLTATCTSAYGAGAAAAASCIGDDCVAAAVGP